ncbi:class III extradiol ring-cleavage dioxygenase [Arthrobacter sp. S39]|uniref:DODA-type extradiol aromatic ring-opening family dioxygenase n=1 Tax=Arthrobacter sp. S39 TaxID=2509720 RepID=UPI001037E46B|nr:class III extradiol ring-cleavage dioxygenase [Arthrobacter sp. S39]TAP39078.1 dioxygenase [Arthrobacter sp. S39]
MATTDPFNPARPAGAYDDLLTRVLPRAKAQKPWQPEDGPLPSLFVSHGAPPTLDDPEWLNDLFTWSQSMPKPRAIVIVSAHWENAPLAITGIHTGTPLYYDFGGFHPRYYTVKYPTPDATTLARRIAGTLADTTAIHHHANRGLDHGAFIPLMAMYPAADVPVVQLSMPSLDPETLLRLGQRLKQLREEGVLIIGSGFMTHSFAVMRNPGLIGYTRAFDEWANNAIIHGDIDALTDYAAKGPGARIAHPTADHFVPLLLTFGAATDPSTATTTIDRVRFGNSIRSIQVA